MFFLNGYTDNELAKPVNFPLHNRLLLLDGDDGTIACRVYGHLMSGTIPRFSDNWTLESATRSLSRMQNLTAVRGVPGASMVGPVDYLGNLEDPHQFLYLIKGQFPPLFYRIPLNKDQTERHLKEFDPTYLTVVKAHWVSGKEKDLAHEKQVEYNVTPKDLRQSLFLDPGILEIDQERIELRAFDCRDVDLSSFKARLVDHQIPFQITKKELPSRDDYRLITYLYEPLYADWQVQRGSGLFLERHQFSQTITPINPDSCGYVVLARMNENPDELELIGVQIPYGLIRSSSKMSAFMVIPL